MFLEYKRFTSSIRPFAPSIFICNLIVGKPHVVPNGAKPQLNAYLWANRKAFWGKCAWDDALIWVKLCKGPARPNFDFFLSVCVEEFEAQFCLVIVCNLSFICRYLNLEIVGALLIPWTHVVFDFLLIQHLNGSRVIHTDPVFALFICIQVMTFVIILVGIKLLNEDSVNLSWLLLAKRHEYDWAFGRHRVDNKRWEHHNQDWAERQAKVALVSAYVLEWVAHEKAERLPAALSTFQVVHYLCVSCCLNFHSFVRSIDLLARFLH